MVTSFATKIGMRERYRTWHHVFTKAEKLRLSEHMLCKRARVLQRLHALPSVFNVLTISGNLLLARSKPGSGNYIVYWHSSGSASLSKPKVTGCGGPRHTQNSINSGQSGDSSTSRGIRLFTFFGSWLGVSGQYTLIIEPPRQWALIRATERLDLDIRLER